LGRRNHLGTREEVVGSGGRRTLVKGEGELQKRNIDSGGRGMQLIEPGRRMEPFMLSAKRPTLGLPVSGESGMRRYRVRDG